MLGKAAIAVVLTLAVIGTTGQILFPPKPILFYNPTNSAAVGWYKIKPNAEIVSGVQVAAFAPEWARQLADERGYLPYDYPLICLLYTSPSPRDRTRSRMPSSA